MILRRLTGLALSTLLLQLSFASSDIACVKHEGNASDATQHAMANGHSMQTGAHDGHPAPHESQSCEIPAQRDCCLALASCSTILGLSSTPAGTQRTLRAPAIAPPAAVPPAYLIRAPEPPPPKV